MNSFGTSPLELMACDAMLKGLVYLDEFSYNAAFITSTATALAANGTTDVQLQFDSDADFICQEVNFTAWTAADTILAAPDYLLTLIRSGSGRQLMNINIPVSNYAGNYRSTSACFPGKMPITSLYSMNTVLTVRLQNRTGTACNRADFTLRGFKVFYVTNPQGMTGTRRDIFHAL